MSFDPTDLTVQQPEQVSQQASLIRLSSPEQQWNPILSSPASFSTEIFERVMFNLIRNPNHNSGYLFRADIKYDYVYERDIGDEVEEGKGEGGQSGEDESIRPMQMKLEGFRRTRTIVRKLIPRNPRLDRPLLQTCYFFTACHHPSAQDQTTVVVYIPHAASAEEIPFYHPAVRAIGFVHTLTDITIHYAPFAAPTPPAMHNRLHRTARQLLQTLHKHGHGTAAGYVKRVHHDLIVPQARYQDTYTRLKMTHAKQLVDNWAEATDAAKHVFEDLGIAAFLIEVWHQMYPNGGEDFPGFVDVGCGNGVLVDILVREGWKGWGMDARRRKSWKTFPAEVQASLKEMILVPAPLLSDSPTGTTTLPIHNDQGTNTDDIPIHTGVFLPNRPFLISNHADELTAWTPILGALAHHAPFLIIPCCSHDLSGARFRAPCCVRNPNDADAEAAATTAPATHPSAYASLVEWIRHLASSLGYLVESDMLRIPSTRNTALLCRKTTTTTHDSRMDNNHDDASSLDAQINLVLNTFAGENWQTTLPQPWIHHARKLQRGR